MWTIHKNQRKNAKFKGTKDSQKIYQNKLNKGYFQHDMAYGIFKGLRRRTVSDKILGDKALNIAKISKYEGYQRGLASIIYILLIKTSSGKIKELTEELHKPTIKKFSKQKITFIDNIWGDDFAGMQLISKFNKRFRFLLCVIDIYSKYARAFPLKDKKELQLESKCKSNKMWVDKGSKFYNGSMKLWLEKKWCRNIFTA